MSDFGRSGRLRTTLKRLTLAIIAFVFAVLAMPTAATAAKSCGEMELVNGKPAKVATIQIFCTDAEPIFEYVINNWWRRSSDSLYVKDFRCTLDSSKTRVKCQRYTQWIFGSTNPSDSPGYWEPTYLPFTWLDARDHVEQALTRKYGTQFRRSYDHRFYCDRPLGFKRTHRCHMDWYLGDLSWGANLRIHSSQGKWRTEIRVAGKAIRFNIYCAILGKPVDVCVKRQTIGPITFPVK